MNNPRIQSDIFTVNGACVYGGSLIIGIINPGVLLLRDTAQTMKNYKNLMPSYSLAVLYIVVGCLLLVLADFNNLWQYFLNRAALSPMAITQTEYASVTKPIFDFTDKLNLPLLMLFWGLFGIVVYVIIFGLRSTFFAVSSELKKADYLQGGLAPQKHYWQSRLSSIGVFVALFGCWVVYTALFFRLILPNLAKLLSFSLLAPSLVNSLADVFGSIILSSIALYALVALLQLLKYDWQTVRT